MSSQQATLSGDFLDSGDEGDDGVVCPLCGYDDVTSKVALPDHIASDECDSEHKEVHYQ